MGKTVEQLARELNQRLGVPVESVESLAIQPEIAATLRDLVDWRQERLAQAWRSERRPEELVRLQAKAEEYNMFMTDLKLIMETLMEVNDGS